MMSLVSSFLNSHAVAIMVAVVVSLNIVLSAASQLLDLWNPEAKEVKSALDKAGVILKKIIDFISANRPH